MKAVPRSLRANKHQLKAQASSHTLVQRFLATTPTRRTPEVKREVWHARLRYKLPISLARERSLELGQIASDKAAPITP